MKPLPDLSRAFSPVPPVVHTRITQTLEEIHHMKKRKVSVAFVLAAVLTLALASAAFAAAQSGVLRFLLGDTTPNAAQQQMVQPVGLSHQSKDMTVTVTDAVFDGAQLSLALDFSRGQGVYALIDHLTINGINVFLNYDNLDDAWLIDPYAMQDGAVIRGLCGDWSRRNLEDEDLARYPEAMQRMQDTGTVDISLGLTLLTPKAQLEHIATYGEDSAAVWAKIDAAIAAGRTPIEADDPWHVLIPSAAMREMWGDEWNNEWPAQTLRVIRNIPDYAAQVNMDVLDSFTLDFTLQAQTTPASVRNPDIKAADVCVHFEEVFSSAIFTNFRLTIASDTLSNAELEQLYRYFELFSPDRQPLDLTGMRSLSLGAGFEEQADGSLLYTVNGSMETLADMPEELLLVPFQYDANSQKAYEWDRAIPVHLQ